MALSTNERMIIKLYQVPGHCAYFYVNPFTGFSKWFRNIVADMSPFCAVDKIDLIIINNKKNKHNLLKPTVNTDIIIPKPCPVIKYLNCFYITVETNSRDKSQCPNTSEFVVPMQQHMPNYLEVANLRLHKAIIPKSQYVIDKHNYEIIIEYTPEGSDEGCDWISTTVLELQVGDYSATQIATMVQELSRVQVHPSFVCTLNQGQATFTFECDIPFRFNVCPSGQPIRFLCLYPIGLHPGDTLNPHYYSPSTLTCHSTCGLFYIACSKPNGENGFTLTSSHIDVSGCKLLQVRVRELHDRLIGCIPLHDIYPSKKIVYYKNPRCSTLERGWPSCKGEVHAKRLRQFHCSVTDTTGRLYNFHGMNCTYIFEVTYVDYRLNDSTCT